jgi:hypothetical protein
MIRVTDLCLAVEHNYSSNPFVTQVDKNTFAWYKNSRFGTNNLLSVMIQVKDEDGKACTRKLPSLKLKTELVYDDDSPAPLRPLCPLRDSQKKNPSLIFNRIYGEPSIPANESEQGGSITTDPKKFSFRIEEVTFHHSGHKGFKLFVSLKNEIQQIPSLIIHQSPMDEVIVVLSKPKINLHQAMPDLISTKNGKRKRNKINQLDDSDDETANNDIDVNIKVGEAFEHFNSSHDLLTNANQLPVSSDDEERSKVDVGIREKDEIVVIPLGALIDSYRCLDSCFCCNIPIKKEEFLSPSQHEASCIFATQVLPLLTLMGVKESSIKVENISTETDADANLQLSPFSRRLPSTRNAAFKERNTNVDSQEKKSTVSTELKISPIPFDLNPVGTVYDMDVDCLDFPGGELMLL